MRTHTLLSLSVLGLLLWASCIQANDAKEPQEETNDEEKTDEEDAEEAPKKEKTTEIEEEKDVMVLHINNFARALEEKQYLLVEFYAPWCGHCKQLEPLFAKAAQQLKKEEPTMGLAKVDCMEEKELAEEFEVSGFPSLKLFINGDRKQPVDYAGKRSPEGITEWLKRRAGPGAATLDSADSAAKFIDANKIAVVGFFESLESEAAKTFSEVVMEVMDVQFGVTATPEVFQKYEVKADAVVLFKQFDEGRADFALSEDGKLDKTNLTTFINDKSLELIIPFTKETAEKIFGAGVEIHTLLFLNSTVESQTALVEEFRPVAKEFKGKMLFVTIDVTAEMTNVLKYFGVSADAAPTVRFMNTDTNKKFKIDKQDLTVKSLRQMSQEVVDGTAKPYYRSEPIPEDWNKGPVKVLVGQNFEAVALDPTKNVFVEFYAPWCGHCKELTPIWEKLGEKYADHDDIIIAMMDATANEAESVTVEGFPTIHYYPAGGKEVVLYTGQRDLETFSKFLDDGGVLPEEEKDEDEDDEEDDDDKAGDDSRTQANTTSKDEL